MAVVSWCAMNWVRHQSGNAQHSKPLSFASRIVVAKQHSVVTPLTIRCVMAFAFNLSNKGVFQKAPFPGLSIMISSGRGLSSSTISCPYCPLISNRPISPVSPITLLYCESPGPPIGRISLDDGQSDKSGVCPSLVWKMVIPACRKVSSSCFVGAIEA